MQCVLLGHITLKPFYILLQWDRSCGSTLLSHSVTAHHWHRANQSQNWPCNARRLAGQPQSTNVSVPGMTGLGKAGINPCGPQSQGSCLATRLLRGLRFVCCLLNVLATCECISGTVLLTQFYALPHWDRSCRSNFPSHPVTVYWHGANQSQHWPYNARCLAG